MSIRRVVMVIGRIGLVFVGVLVATLFAEGAARLRDGQRLFSRRLAPVATLPSVAPPPAALALDPETGGSPLPPDVHREWLAICHRQQTRGRPTGI